MKITGIEVVIKYVRWREWLFVRVSTDEGLFGWGEGSTSDRGRAVAAVIQQFTPRLLGRDSSAIELIWRDLYTGWRGGPIVNSAISAIDGALWDLQGKRFGVPVWKLLGGPVRRKVRVYAGGVSRWLDSVAGHVDGAVRAQNQGYRGVKVTPFGSPGERTDVAAIRFAPSSSKAFATPRPDFEIHIDCAERLTPRLAIEASRPWPPPVRFGWKNPFQPRTSRPCARSPRAWQPPSPAGEKLFSRQDYRELLEGQGAAFIQPDLTHAGGITEVRKIAAAAETYHVQVAPHNSGGPVSAAMAMQIAAVTPNFQVLETAFPNTNSAAASPAKRWKSTTATCTSATNPAWAWAASTSKRSRTKPTAPNLLPWRTFIE